MALRCLESARIDLPISSAQKQFRWFATYGMSSIASTLSACTTKNNQWKPGILSYHIMQDCHFCSTLRIFPSEMLKNAAFLEPKPTEQNSNLPPGYTGQVLPLDGCSCQTACVYRSSWNPLDAFRGTHTKHHQQMLHPSPQSGPSASAQRAEPRASPQAAAANNRLTANPQNKDWHYDFSKPVATFISRDYTDYCIGFVQ